MDIWRAERGKASGVRDALTGWLTGNAVKDFLVCFRPERPFLSAQAEGLGTKPQSQWPWRGRSCGRQWM